MQTDQSEPLWVERYRPQTVDDCLLPATQKAVWKGFVKDKLIPNLTLVGPPGTGKTTVVLAALNDLKASFLFINAAKDANMEMVRERITDFCMTRSLVSGRKYVVLDEVENLSELVQKALRGAIEAYSSNAGFILTCNDLSGVSEPILSRCPPQAFRKWKITTDVADRIVNILETEKVEFDPVTVAALLKKRWPDLRRLINNLQVYASGHKRIDAGILEQGDDLTEALDVLFVRIKNRDFHGIRSWVAEKVSRETISDVLRQLYGRVLTAPWPEESRNIAVIELGELSNVAPHCVDVEISFAATLTKIAGQIKWNSG